MNSQFGVWLCIALWSGSLSGGQAWVFRTRALRFGKHLLVWVAATLVVMGLAFALVGIARDAHAARQDLIRVGAMAGVINALSLLTAGVWKGRAAAGAASFTESAARLAYIHSAFVILGGGIGILALGLLRLSAARF